jgi:hypothetical protein
VQGLTPAVTRCSGGEAGAEGDAPASPLASFRKLSGLTDRFKARRIDVPNRTSIVATIRCGAPALSSRAVALTHDRHSPYATRLAGSALPRRDIAPLHFAYDPM